MHRFLTWLLGCLACWVAYGRRVYVTRHPEIDDKVELDCLEEAINRYCNDGPLRIQDGNRELKYIDTIIESCEQNLIERPNSIHSLRLAGLRRTLQEASA